MVRKGDKYRVEQPKHIAQHVARVEVIGFMEDGSPLCKHLDVAGEPTEPITEAKLEASEKLN